MAQLDLTIPSLELSDGNKIPILGYGTGTAWYKRDANAATDKELVEAAKTAMKLGYTHLDGAEMYNTEPELGKAIKESKIPRAKLFVTTKVWNNLDDIPSAIDASLKKLGLDYVDLYLIHAPFTMKDDADIQKKWAQMEEVATSGKAKSIGVSNFLKSHLEVVLKTCRVRPVINQIEFNPYLQHGDLLRYQKENDIRVAAYGPLIPITKASDGPLTPLLEQLAKKYAVNPSEILLRWCMDQDVVPVTTSSKEIRMSDYLRVCTFNMTPKEIEQISEVGNKHHFRAFWQQKFDAKDRS